MKIKHTVQRALVWDKVSEQMTIRWKVVLYLLGKHKDVIMISGPLYGETSDDVIEAREILRERLKAEWFKHENSRNL